MAYNGRMALLGQTTTYGQFSQVSYATETEAEILRGRMSDLEEQMKALQEQNELLRRQVAALKDGVWLRQA